MRNAQIIGRNPENGFYAPKFRYHDKICRRHSIMTGNRETGSRLCS